MAPPDFNMRLRRPSRIPDKVPPTLTNQNHVNDEPLPQKQSKTQKKSRRMHLKDTNFSRYEKTKEMEKIRSSIRRSERSPDETARDNNLSKIRQRRYRARKAAEKKTAKTKKKVNNQRTTRSEIEKVKANKAKDAKRKSKERKARSPEEHDIQKAERRRKYAEKVVAQKAAKFASMSTTCTQTTHTQEITETPSRKPSSSAAARRKRLSRGKLPNNAQHLQEMIEDLRKTRNPARRGALRQAMVKLQINQNRQKLDNELGKIITKEVNERGNKSLASAMHILKREKLQRYASKALCINRKTLKEHKKVPGRKALSMDTVSKIQAFYESVAQPLPEKKMVSKKTCKPKMLLNQPVKQIYQQFKKLNPNVKCAQTQFFKYRPSHVKSMTTAQYRGCLCEYCENVKLKINVLDSHLQTAGLGNLKLRDSYRATNHTLCDKADGAPFHRYDCIRRQCKDCGVQGLEDHLSSIPPAAMMREVSWKKWDNVSTIRNGKTSMRKALVFKYGTMQALIAELVAELKPHAEHVFVWRWQAKQYTHLKANLPSNWVLSVWDFAENFTCFTQDEAQSSYWSRNQVTIHPVVTYYSCETCNEPVTESLVFISPDVKHDYDAVHEYMELVSIHLQQKRGIRFDKLVRFSDGCASQYKSKGPIADVAHSSNDYTYQVSHHYYGSRHGKGASDGESAVVKSNASNAIKCGALIVDARNFYNHCQEALVKEPTEGRCLHYRRNFYYIENVTRNRPRCNIKTVKGTRSLQSVMATKDDTSRIKTRNLSCFCTACREDESLEECVNKQYVKSWDVVSLSKAHVAANQQPGEDDVAQEHEVGEMNNSNQEDGPDTDDANQQPGEDDVAQEHEDGEMNNGNQEDGPDDDSSVNMIYNNVPLNSRSSKVPPSAAVNTEGYTTDHDDSMVNGSTAKLSSDPSVNGNAPRLPATSENCNGKVDEIKVGDYVAVIYDDAWWPGEVKKIVEEKYHINFLHPKGDNRFVWPDADDSDELHKTGIFTRLPSHPYPINNRYLGFDTEVAKSVTTRVKAYLKKK